MWDLTGASDGRWSKHAVDSSPNGLVANAIVCTRGVLDLSRVAPSVERRSGGISDVFVSLRCCDRCSADVSDVESGDACLNGLGLKLLLCHGNVRCSMRLQRKRIERASVLKSASGVKAEVEGLVGNAVWTRDEAVRRHDWRMLRRTSLAGPEERFQVARNDSSPRRHLAVGNLACLFLTGQSDWGKDYRVQE